MFLNKLNVHNIRCIKSLSLDFTKSVNIFHGTNGAGKTSLLESIYFLSTGKSFRKGGFKSLLKSGEKSFTVYGKSNCNHSYSVSRSIQGEWSAKINLQRIKKHSEITSKFKVISIDPEVYRLIDFGPQARRSFLDWYVFHVEHQYLSLWKNVNKALKQLNSLYKQKKISDELKHWEIKFSELSESLDCLRIKYFELLNPVLKEMMDRFQPELDSLKIDYKKGWSDTMSLQEQLVKERERSFKYGLLQSGPHKMDLKVSVNNIPASQSLSRGQKKILSILFYLSYYEVLLKNTNTIPILCLDDLDAELDDKRISLLSEYIKKSPSQVFISTVQVQKIEQFFPNAEMFHVKQGEIKV